MYIGDTVSIRINGIAGFKRIINTICIGICTASGINIVTVIDTISIAVITTQLCFDGICDTVVVGVEVEVIRCSITV